MIKFKKRFDDLKFANLPNTNEMAKKYGHDYIIKLNYNENKFGPSENIRKSIKIKSPNIYPEYTSPESIKKLANLFNLDKDNFYISNGSDSILDYIPTLFASKTEGHNIVIPELTYGRIATTAKINDIETKLVELVDDKIDLNKMFDAIDKKTAIVYIVNPNMPHGTLNSHEQIKNFLTKVPKDVLVVIDEAYIEYAIGIEKSFELDKNLIDNFDNLIITRTMSKMFAIASFRVGYMISNKEIVYLFRKAAQSLPINKYSLQAMRSALSDIPYYDNVKEKTEEGKERIYKVFDELGIEYVPSKANFILIKMKNASEAREYILKTEGVMIRQVRDWGLRMTVGTPEELDKAINGFKGFINAQG